jgi:hypothetical protein
VESLENWRIGDCRLEIGRISNLQSLISIFPAAGGILLLVGLAVSWGMYGRFQPIIERLFLGLAGAPSAFADATAFYSYTFWQLLTLGVVLLGVAVVLWLSGKGGKQPAPAKARGPYWIHRRRTFLIITDVFLTNRGFNASNDPALLDFKPEMVQWLEAQRLGGPAWSLAHHQLCPQRRQTV